MKRSYVILVKISLLIVVGIVIVGYGLFQARDLLTGPKIFISTPIDGESTTTPAIVVAGFATNIAHISLDDRPIFVDKFGNFSEKLLLQPGYNIIKIRVQDRFGVAKQKLLQLNYISNSVDEATSSSNSIIQ